MIGPPNLNEIATTTQRNRGKRMAIHIKKSHKGLLHKDLGVGADKKIPAGKLEKATHSSNAAVKKRAVFAENAKHWHHGGAKHASQPHPVTNPGFYDTEPHAPSNKITKRKLVQGNTLGDAAPAMVPSNPGRSSGLGGAPHSFKAPHGGGHGYGHNVINRLGSLRMSGHPGAHKIGKR